MKRRLLCSLITLCLSLPLYTGAVCRQETPRESPKSRTISLPDGTEFNVITTDEISSKTATEGDPLSFKVDEDVKIDGAVLIEKGALAKGTVVNAEKNGHMGKGGKLGI